MSVTLALQGSRNSPPVVVLTGATGFLGGAVASELLRSGDAIELLFLVRARSRQEGLTRLTHNLKKFAVPRAQLEALSPDAIVCGSLDEAAVLGHPAARRVTHLVNCAAMVSFAWDRTVWRVNVEDTEAYARAAQGLPRLERFVHISTALVSGATRDRMVSEAEFPADARQFTLYTKSKAEIERRLPALLGSALTIVRPSVIVGHTRLGCGPSGSLFWLFRMIHAARCVPFPPEHRIDVVPVDYCAQAIAALLFDRELAHACYHVSAGDRSASFAEIDRAFFRARGASEGGALATFDVARLSELAAHFESWFGPCDPLRAAGAIRVYAAFAGLNVTYDNARLLAQGLPPPARFCDYLDRCVRSASRVPISTQMAHDFH